jgi:hypothetical protein
MDNLKFFNYAMTPAQIAWDYNQGKAIGWWKLDECAGTVANDSSGFSITGSIGIGASAPQTTAGTCTTPTDGTGAWYNGRSGKFNSSLSFDGVDDYVSIPNNTALQLTNNFSISVWFKPANLTQTNTYILGKYNDYALLWEYTNNTVNLYTNGQTGTSPQSVSGMTISDTNWHHLVYTYNGTTLYGYVDGVNIVSPAISFSCRTSANPLVVGAGSTVPAGMVNAQIDDLRLFSYPLTAIQIKQVYNNGAVTFGPTTGIPQ